MGKMLTAEQKLEDEMNKAEWAEVERAVACASSECVRTDCYAHKNAMKVLSVITRRVKQMEAKNQDVDATLDTMCSDLQAVRTMLDKRDRADKWQRLRFIRKGELVEVPAGVVVCLGVVLVMAVLLLISNGKSAEMIQLIKELQNTVAIKGGN